MWRILLGLLLACLPDAFAILTPVTDPVSLEKYMISYIPLSSWEQTIASNESALSMGRIIHMGDQMSCYVSNSLAGSSNISDEIGEENLDEYMASILETSINIITESVTNCLTFFSGFWKYEYCPNGTLAQYHGDPKTSSLYYVLAKTKASLNEREFRLLYNDFGYYISEIISSGDICDMTGQPRVVDLQYVCGPAAGSASIQWVREHKTCHYEVQITVPSLCNLELLSKNGDKKLSTSLICLEDKSQKMNVVDIVTKFEPTFMGNELYLLRPYNLQLGHPRTSILYTGQLIVNGKPKEKDSEALARKFNQVIGRMLLQEHILAPDGLPFNTGDELSWLSEVFDLNGNMLTVVQFNIDFSSIVRITFDSSSTFTDEGNFLSYKRNYKNTKIPNVDFEGKESDFGPQDSLDLKDIEFVFIDDKIDSNDKVIMDGTEYLLEEILSPEQLADLLEKLGNTKQGGINNENGKKKKLELESSIKVDTTKDDESAENIDEQPQVDGKTKTDGEDELNFESETAIVHDEL